jgi:hypothetical protein
METTKLVLSSLWIFVMFNYLYCDVVGLMDAELLKKYLSGNIDGMQINQDFLLGASVLMEIPITMILLSRILTYRANRLANIVAGTLMTVVQLATLFMGGLPTLYYMFFSLIEISCTLYIVWFAWRWAKA